jgi:hypothetical protein
MIYRKSNLGIMDLDSYNLILRGYLSERLSS